MGEELAGDREGLCLFLPHSRCQGRPGGTTVGDDITGLQRPFLPTYLLKDNCVLIERIDCVRIAAGCNASAAMI